MSEDLTKPVPHPDFAKLKDEAWKAFEDKDYENTAKTAAQMLQNSHAFDAIHLAGLALYNLERFEEGHEWLCASLALSRGRPDWYVNAANAALKHKDFVRAMLFAENGNKDYPEDIRLSHMRGLVMCHAQEWEKALEYLKETAELDPDFYTTQMTMGFCYHMMADYEQALRCYSLIIPVTPEPDREEVINNYACVLLELAKHKEALDLLDKEYPGSERPGTLYNKSFLYLGMGRFPEAWHLYRNRVIVQRELTPEVTHPIAETLEDIKGKKLFLFHEQGLGDSLMFVRYAALLRPYVSELVIGVPQSLNRLVKLLDIEDVTVVSGDESDIPIHASCEVAIPMLSAPDLLNTTLETIPSKTPYFKIPENTKFLTSLPPRSDKPRVGLAWSGSARPDDIRAHSIDKRRSIPFDIFKKILDLSDMFEFVSLQLPDHHVDDDRILQPLSIECDVLDTSGIIQQLDLVIAIDSAMAHLAGALDKPVWLLSRYDGCWRWFWPDDESDFLYHRTPWYEKMYIFRQKGHWRWPEVIDEVIENLKEAFVIADAAE